MAGGTWTSQNKVRPGAYINFKGVSAPTTAVGSRGIVTLPLPMSWGAQITEILSLDLAAGKTLETIGYVVTDEEAQIFREALKNCYKAIIYRVDAGGEKADAIIGNLTATAKYAGVVGNRISIAIVANSTKFDVYTYVDGVQKDKQVALATVAEVQDNAWVDFSGTLVLTANAGTTLTGGTDGTVSDANYTAYLNAIQSYNYNTMGIPVDNATVAAAVETFIKLQRDTYGKKIQAVLYDYAGDYEGIISVDQGYKTTNETVSAPTFVAYVAGLTAGSEVNQSNTYHAITGAVEIVSPKTDSEIETALAAGKMVLSYRIDGAIVIEQDINTLHTFTVEKPYSFSKNRVIRTLDGINNDLALSFQKNYIGKVNNNADGRNLYKASVVGYLNTLQGINAIQNFDSTTDVVISAGEAIDAVVADLAIQPVDSMEKIYMTVLVS
jgi:hypothetical protein